MFVINEDNSIYATRGDIVFFSVSADDDGAPYHFQAGDVVRFKVYGKKDAENVVLQKDFPVTDVCEEVEIYLTEEDTKIGDVISKPADYWYEVELNPFDHPQTIIGYDEDGAKVFKLFPEGDDINEYVPDPEDFPVVDEELDMTSTRPVQNQAIARAFRNLEAGYEKVFEAVAEKFVTPEMFGAIGDGEADDTDAIESMFAAGNGCYMFRKAYKLRHGVTVPGNSKLYSEGATFNQPNFGRGIFVARGNNIDFYGTYYFNMVGDKTKLDVEGVECSALLLEDEVNNLHIERFYIYNFIGGVTSGGSTASNITADYIHVENCDFGIWGANMHNVSIGVLSFKDIDNSQNEPAHALYLTGNNREIKTTNFHVGLVHGENCVAALTDCVLSVKGTSQFSCDKVYVKNVNCVITPLNSSGYVRNIYADGVWHYCFDLQGNSPDGQPFVIEDGCFVNLDCDYYCYGAGASANAIVRNCKFIGESAEGFVYLSSVEDFTEENCYFKNTGTATIAVYNIASTAIINIISPTVVNASMVNHIQSGVNVVFKLNPALIDNGLCNNAMYNTFFLPNDYFKQLSNVNDNWIFNNIIADNCTITQMRGNGVFTILNKNRTSSIMDLGNTKLILKGGKTQYTAQEWDLKTFRVINSIAYEI